MSEEIKDVNLEENDEEVDESVIDGSGFGKSVVQKDIDKVSQDVKDINTTTNKLSNKFDKIQNGKISYLEDKEMIE